MRQVFSVMVAIALLVGLSALAVLALPHGQTMLNPPLGKADGQSSSTPVAIGTTDKFNAIALPLDVQATWASAGFSFTAQGLAEYIGLSSVSQVLRLNPSLQGYDSWFPDSGFGFLDGTLVTTPWPLQTGMAYRVVLNANNPSLNTFSLLGAVPPQGSITFTLVGESPGCKLNDIMVPLDQPSITNANDLALSLGGSSNVSQVLRLNATLQGYDSWYPESGFGFVNGSFTTTPFPVQVGYPYAVCLTGGANGLRWP